MKLPRCPRKTASESQLSVQKTLAAPSQRLPRRSVNQPNSGWNRAPIMANSPAAKPIWALLRFIGRLKKVSSTALMLVNTSIVK